MAEEIGKGTQEGLPQEPKPYLRSELGSFSSIEDSPLGLRLTSQFAAQLVELRQNATVRGSELESPIVTNGGDIKLHTRINQDGVPKIVSEAGDSMSVGGFDLYWQTKSDLLNSYSPRGAREQVLGTAHTHPSARAVAESGVREVDWRSKLFLRLSRRLIGYNPNGEFEKVATEIYDELNPPNAYDYDHMLAKGDKLIMIVGPTTCYIGVSVGASMMPRPKNPALLHLKDELATILAARKAKRTYYAGKKELGIQQLREAISRPALERARRLGIVLYRGELSADNTNLAKIS